MPTGSFSLTPNQMLPGGRSGYAMALLQSGKVLIAGGHDSAGTVLSSAELLDPSTGGFKLTANPMSIARNNFSATALGNGTVLLAGGLNSQGVTASAELYDPVSNTFTTLTSMMSVARAGQRATLLTDGTVLLSGGFGPDGASLSTSDYFDPATSSFATGPSMSTPRNRHTATRLNSGDVLIVGGDNDLKPLAGAELYVPSGHESGSFVPLSAQMTTSRTGAAASLMPNGDVLISGGATVSGGRASNLATADVYDPTTQQFSAAANSMSSARFLGTSTLLADRRVLVAGGFAGGASIFSLVTNAVDIFNPTDNSFTPAAPLLIGRGNNAATMLGDGRVFLPAGTANDGGALADAELYAVTPPTSSSQVTGGMNALREFQASARLPDGRILISGGDNAGGILNSAETFDPKTALFTPTGPMKEARTAQTATLLNNGLVLVAAGSGDTTAELFDPATNTFSAIAAQMNAVRSFHTATLLKDGTVLVAGGIISRGMPLNSAELFDPATNTFTAVGNMTEPRGGATANLLPNGMVLIAGGSTTGAVNGDGATATAEIYDPVTHSFKAISATLDQPRFRAAATTLNDGSLLIVDGTNDLSLDNKLLGLADAQIYLPTSGKFVAPSVQPTVTRNFLDATLLNADGC